jgi:hypothetical protein
LVDVGCPAAARPLGAAAPYTRLQQLARWRSSAAAAARSTALLQATAIAPRA